MKKIIFLNIVFFIVLSISNASAEYVFLKDGKIVIGQIMKETPFNTFIRLKNRKILVVKQHRILRIMYLDLYLGKLFIHLTNGKIKEAYIVVEGPKSFIVRENLYKPDEYKLLRRDVLYTARKNPNNLKEKSEIGYIDLRWDPSHGKIKQYNIYLKIGNRKYKLIGNTKSKRYTIDNLKSNVAYYIIVKSVDNNDYESLPSNEIKIETNKGMHKQPEGLKLEKELSEDEKKMSIKLTWDPYEGKKIKGYNVYSESGFEKLTFTNKTSFELKNLDPNDQYVYSIRAVDINGAKSLESKLVATREFLSNDLKIYSGYYIPLRDFKGLMNNGWGVNLYYSFNNIFIEHFNLGINLGFMYFSGKRDDIISTYMIPLLVSMSHKFRIGNFLIISPKISAGASYNILNNYDYTDYGFISNDKTTKYSVKPMFNTEIEASFILGNKLLIGIDAGYAGFLDKDKIMNFITMHVHMGIKF